MRWPWNCMRKFLLLSLSLLLPALFLLIAWSGTTIIFAQQQPCTSTVSVGSAYGATFGSGSYSCGASLAFGVSPTTITSGDVEYVFSGWSCSGAGCYSGSADPASLTTGGNNSVITETAQWMTEYLLTISSNPSGIWKHESQRELLGESRRISYRYAVRDTA